MPAVHSESIYMSLGEYSQLTAHFENCTIIKQEKAPDASFTTALNSTFHYENAHKITYRTADGITDYFIIWQCNSSADEYYVICDFHDLEAFYSDYTMDNKSVVYIQQTNDDFYGILLDRQNISYTEADLVYEILRLDYRALTYSDYNYAQGDGYYASPQSGYGHYNGPVIDPYETLRNDPYAYYDYFDYEDNIDIDEYLYDWGYE